MDMLELIGMIVEADSDVIYTIQLSYLQDLPPMRFFKEEPEDVYYRNIHPRKPSVKYFWNKDEVIQFLSDKELFGWEVRRYDYEAGWNDYKRLTIDLCKVNT